MNALIEYRIDMPGAAVGDGPSRSVTAVDEPDDDIEFEGVDTPVDKMVSEEASPAGDTISDLASLGFGARRLPPA